MIRFYNTIICQHNQRFRIYYMIEGTSHITIIVKVFEKTANFLINIFSLLIYGSAVESTADKSGDADVAVIVKTIRDKRIIEDLFLSDISFRFNEYFGIQLDVYIKTVKEFMEGLRNNEPPVSTFKKSYMVIYGEDPFKNGGI